jgi:hypothetical protein
MTDGFREVDVAPPAKVSKRSLLTGLVLVTLVVTAISFAGFGATYGLVGLACADTAEAVCDPALLTFGIRLALFGPIAATLLTLAVAIVRLVRKRSALLVALIGLGLSIALFAVGTALVNGAAPGGTLF